MPKYFFPLFISLVHVGYAVTAQTDPDKMVAMTATRRFQNRQDTIYAFYAVRPDRPIKIELKMTYYWFAKDSIFETAGGYAGGLLDGDYQVFYPNKSLMEAGSFHMGLKEGEWKVWNPDGSLKSVRHWKKGEEKIRPSENPTDDKRSRPKKRKKKEQPNSDQ